MIQFAILYEDRFTRMDAAVPVDAQNAPTATWKTAQNAVSHSAHTHHQRALHTKFRTLLGRRNHPADTHVVSGYQRQTLDGQFFSISASFRVRPRMSFHARCWT